MSFMPVKVFNNQDGWNESPKRSPVQSGGLGKAIVGIVTDESGATNWSFRLLAADPNDGSYQYVQGASATDWDASSEPLGADFDILARQMTPSNRTILLGDILKRYGDEIIIPSDNWRIEAHAVGGLAGSTLTLWVLLADGRS